MTKYASIDKLLNAERAWGDVPIHVPPARTLLELRARLTDGLEAEALDAWLFDAVRATTPPDIDDDTVLRVLILDGMHKSDLAAVALDALGMAALAQKWRGDPAPEVQEDDDPT